MREPLCIRLSKTRLIALGIGATCKPVFMKWRVKMFNIPDMYKMSLSFTDAEHVMSQYGETIIDNIQII